MNVVVDGAGMMNGASQVDTAVRKLALIGKRIPPILARLNEEQGMSSRGVKMKYDEELGGEVARMCADLERFQRSMTQITAAYINEVDEADRFMY